MTTKQAMDILNVGRQALYGACSRGQLRKTIVRNKIVWEDTDVYRLAGFDPAARMTVVYARTEGIRDGGGRSAADRLVEQKTRLMNFCESRGWEPDLVIAEVRKVNRTRHDGKFHEGFATLFRLIAEKRVGKLVLESFDRLFVGAPWEAFRYFLELLGVELVVVNRVAVTTESREESMAWLEDMLLMHKVRIGEIQDGALLESFVGGTDPDARSRVKQLDRARHRQEVEERRARRAGVKRLRGPVDLDELFESSSD